LTIDDGKQYREDWQQDDPFYVVQSTSSAAAKRHLSSDRSLPPRAPDSSVSNPMELSRHFSSWKGILVLCAISHISRKPQLIDLDIGWTPYEPGSPQECVVSYWKRKRAIAPDATGRPG